MSHRPTLGSRAIFETAPGLYLVFTTDFTIVAVSDVYANAMTTREKILARGTRMPREPLAPTDHTAGGT
jgi:hypothetical protein